MMMAVHIRLVLLCNGRPLSRGFDTNTTIVGTGDSKRTASPPTNSKQRGLERPFQSPVCGMHESLSVRGAYASNGRDPESSSKKGLPRLNRFGFL